ncbi:dynein light intermediate chain [Brevipalpus obovatus]|uniref:dynein light intermediate chain n=1 Tax=Brevipalpus obovatus TaxID=246614 RepID=UPI003D9E1E00
MDLVFAILRNGQSSSTSTRLPNNKNLLVLGDNETGKSTMVAKIQGNEDPKKGSGLEYHPLVIRDEYRDEQTVLSVWVLDGDLYHTNLLKFPVNQESLPHTTLMLVASMSSPWDILDSLEKWANVFAGHIERMNISNEIQEELKRGVVKRYLEYISPGDEIEGLVGPPKSRSESINEKMDTSQINGNHLTEDILGDGDVLSHNLGVDVVVVITKTDYMSVLEKDYDYKEEHFDFIQQAVRKFCLKYGASLFYVSAKVNKNCDLLFKYLAHRIYGLPFKTPALVVEKDAIFIPPGWDNDKKIAILYENIQSCSPDANYSDIITKPENRQPLSKDVELTAEEDQVFLSKMQIQLNQNVTVPIAAVPSTPIRNTMLAQSGPGRYPSPPMTLPNNPNIGPGGEGVLQNFFNSLLSRRAGSGPGSGSPGSLGSSPRTPESARNRSNPQS